MGACVSSTEKVEPPAKEGSPHRTAPERANSREGSGLKHTSPRRSDARKEAESMIHTIDTKIHKLETKASLTKDSRVSFGESSGNHSPGKRAPVTRATKAPADWGIRRKHLCTDEMTIPEFCQELKLPAQKVRDALTFFQSLDTDRNGVISKEEFAAQMHLSTDNVKVSYALSSVDTDADEQICFREFLVAAVHCVGDAESEFVARFCFKMIDRESKGVVTYPALHNYLVDTLHPEDEGRAVHEKRIHSLMQEDMGLDLDEKIKERDFLATFASHPDEFRPTMKLWKALCNLFKGAFVHEGTAATHTFIEVEKYFLDGGVGVAVLDELPSARPRSSEGFGRRVISSEPQEEEWGYKPSNSPNPGRSGRSSREGSPVSTSPGVRTGSYNSGAALHGAADEFKQRPDEHDTRHASFVSLGASALKHLGGDIAASLGIGKHDTIEDEEDGPATRIFIKKIHKPGEAHPEDEEWKPEHEEGDVVKEVVRGRIGRPKSAEISAKSMSTHSFSGSTSPKPRRFEAAHAGRSKHGKADSFGGRSRSPLARSPDRGGSTSASHGGREHWKMGYKKDPMEVTRWDPAPVESKLHW